MVTLIKRQTSYKHVNIINNGNQLLLQNVKSGLKLLNLDFFFFKGPFKFDFSLRRLFDNLKIVIIIKN